MRSTAWRVNNFYVSGYRGDHHNQHELSEKIHLRRRNK